MNGQPSRSRPMENRLCTLPRGALLPDLHCRRGWQRLSAITSVGSLDAEPKVNPKTGRLDRVFHRPAPVRSQNLHDEYGWPGHRAAHRRHRRGVEFPLQNDASCRSPIRQQAHALLSLFSISASTPKYTASLNMQHPNGSHRPFCAQVLLYSNSLSRENITHSARLDIRPSTIKTNSTPALAIHTTAGTPIYYS